MLDYDGSYVSIALSTASSLVYLKDIKVLGAALSQPEILIEAYRKGNPWDYAGYMRYYFPLDEYPKYVFNDYGINHVAMIYTPAVATDPDPLDMQYRSVSLNTGAGNSGVTWTNEFVTPLCEDYEVYDSKLGRCYDTRSSLMFVRGKTHAITLTPSVLEQNFTVEFWIMLVNASDAYQQIMSTANLYIRYETTGKFNATVYNDSAYQSVAATTSPLKVWTHVAVANSGLLGKSCLYLNGAKAASNSAVLISGTFSTCTVSDDTNGFTGYMREVHFWNEFRSSARVNAEMHNFQWHMNGMNFNLKGYYPLNEARGVTLYDYYITSPSHITSFEVTTTSRVSPFWARTESLPIICKFAQTYDYDLGLCRTTKKVLSISGAGISLPVAYNGPLRDWTFKAWVRYTTLSSGTTLVNIPGLFALKATSTSTIQVSATMDNGVTPYTSTINLIDTSTWYLISVGHSYAQGKIFFEHTKVLQSLPLVEQTPPSGTAGNLTYYSTGALTVFLNNAKFMHVSLWRKYLQTVRADASVPTLDTVDFMDP